METGIVYDGFLVFVAEMLAPLLLCSSIPLGSPPVQDANLGKIAPKQCVFYVGWAGMGVPDAKSRNSAERFLADPEIRHMRAEAARRFRLLMKAAATSSSDANGNGLTVGPCNIKGPCNVNGITVGPCNIPPQISADTEFWCELLVTRPCAGFISHFTASDDLPGYHGAFVMNVGDAAPKVAAMLQRYRKLAKDVIGERNIDGRIEYRAKTDWLASDPRSQAVAEKAAGDKNVVVEIRDPLHLRWTLSDKYLIVVWGDESPAKIVKRMKRPEPEWFAAVGKDLPIERRAAMLRLSLETLAADYDRYSCSNSHDFAKQIRDTHVRAVTLVTGLGHDDFVSQLLVETDGIAGALLKTIVDRPLKAEDLAVIPRDATLAMALRFNPNLIATGLQWLDVQAKEAKKNSAANADKNANDQPPQTETAVPIDVQNWMMSLAMSPGATAQQAITRLCRKPIDIALDDEICTELAASLDDAWRLYTSPGEGSSIFNGMTGVVHVKDAGRLTKLFDKLAARKPPAKPDAKAAEKTANSGDVKSGIWAVRKTRFADRDVYYMVRAQGESAGVLTWCLVKNELVWSLSPQNVKAYLLRQPGGSSLADEPTIIEALRDKQSPTLLMYEDSRRMFRMTYPLMQGWAMVAAAQDGLPTDGIDPMLLPAAPTIAKYLRPAVSTVSVAPKGVQLTMHQSLPNGNLGATLYCVLCSLLPANAEGVVSAAAGTPMIMPQSTGATADFSDLEGRKVAVVCRPMRSLQYANSNVGRDLAQQISLLLQEQVPKIKVIDQRKIAKWTDENTWEEYPEVGKAVKADMVVAVDLESFSLYVGQTLYQGKANATARVFDCKKNGKEVFHKSIPQCIYPPNGAIATSERTEPDFRSEFVAVLADQIARSFFAHDPDAGSVSPPAAVTCTPPTTRGTALVPATAPPAQPTASPCARPSAFEPPRPATASAPCVPPSDYSSTATPTPYLPTPAASASPSASNAVCPYTVSGYDSGAGGYRAPIANAPTPYAAPYVPATPQNSSPPQAWSPTSPYSSAPPVPQGYQRIVVNVPLVIYVPIAATPSGNPPPIRLPAVDPSPSYPPAGYAPSYGAPGYAPSGYGAPASAAPNYAPPPTPVVPRYTPPPTSTPSGYTPPPAVAPRAFVPPTNFAPPAYPLPTGTMPPGMDIPSMRSAAGFSDYDAGIIPPSEVRSSEPAQSSFDMLMAVVGQKIAQGKSAEVERPLAQLSRCPDLSAEQRSQVDGLLKRIRGNAVQPPIVVAGPVVSASQVTIPAGNYSPVAVPRPSPFAAPPTFSPPAASSAPQKPSARPLHQTFTEEEGPCMLKKRSGSDENIFAVEVGRKLHGTFKFYVEDSADGPHITTDAFVQNGSKTDRHFRYEIALLDKSGGPIDFFPKNVSGEGNLAGGGLACKDETCSLLVPEGAAETVASYRVRFWESDRTPAKKK